MKTQPAFLSSNLTPLHPEQVVLYSFLNCPGQFSYCFCKKLIMLVLLNKLYVSAQFYFWAYYCTTCFQGCIPAQVVVIAVNCAM